MDDDRMHHIILEVQHKNSNPVMPTFGGMEDDFT